jgi:hypothetical protein
LKASQNIVTGSVTLHTPYTGFPFAPPSGRREFLVNISPSPTPGIPKIDLLDENMAVKVLSRDLNRTVYKPIPTLYPEAIVRLKDLPNSPMTLPIYDEV